MDCKESSRLCCVTVSENSLPKQTDVSCLEHVQGEWTSNSTSRVISVIVVTTNRADGLVEYCEQHADRSGLGVEEMINL